jgi:hypothetical protein
MNHIPFVLVGRACMEAWGLRVQVLLPLVCEYCMPCVLGGGGVSLYRPVNN